MAHFPQGCRIKLYLDDGSSQEYELHSIHYKLYPTGVAVCTYNTPKNLNALSVNQRWESFFLMEHMAKDPEVKVAIWTGSGDRSFNAGVDLKFDQTCYSSEEVRAQYLKRGLGIIPGDLVFTNDTKAFWDFPKPSICAVNGVAVGGAANIALMNFHDLVVCSENSKFMWPFPRLGFIPELGSSRMLPFVVGMARAKELFYLSDWVTPQQAVALGLANKVVPAEKLMSTAMEMAEKLVVLPEAALMEAKKVINFQLRKDLDEVLKQEQVHFSKAFEETGGPMSTKVYIKEKEEWLKKIKAGSKL